MNRRSNLKRRAAKRRMMQKMAFGAMTGCFVLIFALSVFSLSAKANTSEGANEFKYYTSHMIMPGESLWSIAEENMDETHYQSINAYIDEIKSINGMKNDKLIIGNYIIIPYYAE
ncbi:MAG: LysM peptidoglycan-binding domain-containing protein [Lachnospiraceae bacterium]|nr:LysM peptidoglycan-binding domain-containing protein [Lachnospiraceae bacterium]